MDQGQKFLIQMRLAQVSADTIPNCPCDDQTETIALEMIKGGSYWKNSGDRIDISPIWGGYLRCTTGLAIVDGIAGEKSWVPGMSLRHIDKVRRRLKHRSRYDHFIRIKDFIEQYGYDPTEPSVHQENEKGAEQRLYY